MIGSQRSARCARYKVFEQGLNAQNYRARMTKASGAARHLGRGDAEFMDKTDTINAMLRPRMLIYTKNEMLELSDITVPTNCHQTHVFLAFPGCTVDSSGRYRGLPQPLGCHCLCFNERMIASVAQDNVVSTSTTSAGCSSMPAIALFASSGEPSTSSFSENAACSAT